LGPLTVPFSVIIIDWTPCKLGKYEHNLNGKNAITNLTKLLGTQGQYET
jgi:hypothetical protein